MPRLLAALLVLAAAVPASAQDEYEPFRPLHVGNEWVWQQFYSRSDDLPGSTSYLRVRITGDTTLDGEPARVAECEKFDATGANVLVTATLALPIADDVPPVALEGSVSTCNVPLTSPGSLIPVWQVPEPLPDVEVGAETYAMGAIMQSSTNAQGSGGARYMETIFWGDRLGLYFYELDHRTHWASGYTLFIHKLYLDYAVVDGEVFGASPVPTASEAPPEQPAAGLRAYPSPALNEVAIAGASGEVAVFDLLGRRVAQAEASPGQPVQLDVSAWPAGLYIARSIDGDEVRTVRFVVAR